MTIYIPMIDPTTGEIDTALVAEHAALRAAREYGSASYPPRTLREATQWCLDRAHNERLSWRRDRGLRDDSVVEMREVPNWGASGDSFRRA